MSILAEKKRKHPEKRKKNNNPLKTERLLNIKISAKGGPGGGLPLPPVSYATASESPSRFNVARYLCIFRNVANTSQCAFCSYGVRGGFALTRNRLDVIFLILRSLARQLLSVRVLNYRKTQKNSFCVGHLSVLWDIWAFCFLKLTFQSKEAKGQA